MGVTNWKGNWVFFTEHGGAMLSKSLIQFFVDGWDCVLSLLFTWGQTMVEIMKIIVTFQKAPCMYCYTQCLQSWSRPPLTHASPVDSWTHPGKSGSVSCGVTAPFSWVLVHTRSVYALQESISQSWVSSGSSLVGLMVTPSKRVYAIPKSAAPKAPAPMAVHCWSLPPQETLKHSFVQFCLSLSGVSGPDL